MRKFIIRYLYQASRMLWLLLKPLSMGVRVLLVKDGCVVLVKPVYEREWYIPGGAVERGETLEQAARREACEEVGAQIGALRLFGAYTNLEYGKSDHVVVFFSDDFELDCHSDDEIEACALVPLDELPEELSPGSAKRISEYLAGQRGIAAHW